MDKKADDNKGIVLPVIFSLGLIVIYLLTARWGSSSLPLHIFVVIVVTTVAYYFIVCFVAFHLWIVPLINDKARMDNDCSIGENGSFDKCICEKDPYRYCSAEYILNSRYYKECLNTRELTEGEARKYNLLTDEEFNNMESCFFKGHNCRQIWIISSSLETEIAIEDEEKEKDSSLHRSMKTVEQNIKKGGRYVQFVSSSHSILNGSFNSRKEKYWAALDSGDKTLSDEEKQQKAPIIEIDSDKMVFDKHNLSEEQDWTYLTQLTSTLLLLDNSGNLMDGYFCLRPESEKGKEGRYYRTIFYIMPKNCMALPMKKVLDKELEKRSIPLILRKH